MVRPLILLLPLALGAVATAQHGTQNNDPKAPMYIAPASNDGQEHVKSMQLADGFVADLVAAEPDIANVVAFTIDDQGRFYICESFRVHDGVFDNRSYMHWLDDDLACLKVEDRVAKYVKHFGQEKVDSYATRTERIRMLADSDGNGSLDRVTVFAADFTKMEDGIAAGVLQVGDEILTTIIPKVWRLKDSNGDGIADTRVVMHDGFGVHTSLMGHDMHGLIVGPDRRLYWSIGDRGFHVEQDGKQFAFPHEGAVMRCELDGSNFEVVHRGLRNPQELAFDKWGDLFTGDNNSDGGDRARLVQIQEGADSGWRLGFQYLSDRGVWNREKMWHPRHPEQSAGIAPPIINFADGPSGLVYDTGVGLPERFRDCFFLCDFRGSRSYSGIRTFRLSRNGAGYELRDHDKIAWNVLAPDVEFGPDGALYFIDWVHGWSKTGKGRLFRLRTPQMANDFKLRNVAKLLASDFSKRGKAQLGQLLEHADRRIRQKAQFALVDQQAVDVLVAATRSRKSRVARMHGIWGLGILARTGKHGVGDLHPLLKDDDADVRAMAARAIGDARHKPSTGRLLPLLRDHNSRVKRETALALARIGATDNAKVQKQLIELLRRNNDGDGVLRHAAVVALAVAAKPEQLKTHFDDQSLAVQRGVLLALARQGSKHVAHFLKHTDEQLRYEAARAIYETPIQDAMRPLAKLIWDDFPESARIDHRSINANRVIGQVENAEGLMHMSLLKDHPTSVRLEAIAVLHEWAEPSGRCRVIGNWRPCVHEDRDIIKIRIEDHAPQMLKDRTIAAAAARLCAHWGCSSMINELAKVLADRDMPSEARVAALDALAKLDKANVETTLQTIEDDAPVDLRKRAIALMSKTSPDKAVPLLGTLLDNAPIHERQSAFEALGDLQVPASTAVLREWLGRADVDARLLLDLRDAAAKHDALAGDLKKIEATEQANGALGPFAICLEGGNAKQGRKVFHDFEATRCTRCHTLNGNGGNAGPVLDDVGKRLKSQDLLEALITPSAKIAEGFATTMVELHDGSIYSGVITKDQDGGITIVDITGKATDILWGRIKDRKANANSAMPEMGGSLTKRQLRDLIAFLKKQRK